MPERSVVEEICRRFPAIRDDAARSLRTLQQNGVVYPKNRRAVRYRP